jgi:hypothetical protein
MFYIERSIVSDATWQAGTIAEPSTRETEWSGSGVAYTVGQERIRGSTHRVYRCAVAHTSAASPAPEADPTRWKEIRPTDLYLPFGPWVNASGQTIYSGLAVESTTDNLVWRMALRYPTAVAMFGLRGANVRVQLRGGPGGALLQEQLVSLKRPASGYWDLIYGQRKYRDRLLVHGFPMRPNAELVVSIEGATGQQRRITQIEAGKLRQLHGVDFGGTEYNVNSTPRARMFREQDTDGTEKVLIFGTSQDMDATVIMRGDQENTALQVLRGLAGKGVALMPTLVAGYEQRLTFGVIDSAPTARVTPSGTSVRLSVRGLPVD